VADQKRRRRTRFAEWWAEVHLYVLAGVALAAFALGIVGFREWYAGHGTADATLWDSVYKALQLFTLESGSADTPVPVTLNVARYLALVAALYGATAAVLAVFGEHLARFRLSRASGHAVVCGLGDRGLHVAEQLLREGHRVAVVERDEHAPLLDRVRAAGAVAIIGDATSPAILKKARADRTAYVIAVCPEDGDNAEIAVRLQELCGERSRSTPVTVIAHIYDTELCTLLRERTDERGAAGGVRLRFFNVPESGARAMLDAVPPVSRREGQRPHIVIVGMGKLGRSLAVAAARQWLETRGTSAGRVRLTMVDQSAADKADLLRIRFPRIDEACELVPLTLPKNAPAFERGEFLRDVAGAIDVDAVYVCPDDDVHSLASALTIQRHTRDSGVPIAVRMTREGGLATLLVGEQADAFADLRAVGVLDYACGTRSLLAEESTAG
jgi:fermentation-respiration switch protein FrsA (DUF1100 family)